MRERPRSVRLIGVPSDVHSSYLRGPAKAPAAIRYHLTAGHSNMTAESGLELGTDVPWHDEGDLPLTEGAGDDAIISNAVRQAVADDVFPLMLGGDHAVTPPIVAALAAAHGPVSILHIDAHPDLYDVFDDDPHSHACPFARIMEARHASRLVQVGIRTLNAHQRAQAERFGVEIFEMRDFSIERVPTLTGPCYVSIDLDGFDPAYAPGVSHPEPGGLTVREVLALLEHVQGPLVGADIVELNPDRDLHGHTAALCAKLVKELAALSARRPRPRP